MHPFFLWSRSPLPSLTRVPSQLFFQTERRNLLLPACEALHWFLRALWASPEAFFFFYVGEVEGTEFCKDATFQGVNANEQHESSSPIAPIPPCAAHVCDHSSSRFEREKLLTFYDASVLFAKKGRPGDLYVNMAWQ